MSGLLPKPSQPHSIEDMAVRRMRLTRTGSLSLPFNRVLIVQNFLGIRQVTAPCRLHQTDPI